jgi:probable rRNA maturation factor
MFMPVHLAVEGGPYAGVSPAELRRRARAMLGAVEQPKAVLSLLLTDDEKIKKLNAIYRKKNRPTDVLAFSQLEGEGKVQSGRLLGDVVLSVPAARRQAEARGCDLMAELTMLLAHGLLHLLGWDHETALKEARMRRETRRLCSAANTEGRVPRARRPRSRTVNGTTVAAAFGDSLVRRGVRTLR